MPSSEENMSPRPKEVRLKRPATSEGILSPETSKEYEFRQKVARAYQQSGTIKGSLRNCIRFHLFLGFLMVVKQIPYILDKLDIFFLAIEELEVPKPLVWEWVWLGSCLGCFVGLRAIKRNKHTQMNVFISSEFILGLVPVFWCFVLYFSDVMKYLSQDNSSFFYGQANIIWWKGYPYGLLNYIFLVGAIQTHGFGIYYANKLINLWGITRGRKTQ